MLSRISKLVVQFVPLRQDSRSAKEFLARLKTPRATATNPDCKVEARIRTAGACCIDVEFTNRQRERILTSELTADQIFEKINEKSQVLESQEILKKVGMSTSRLESGWGSNAHKTGVSKRIPLT